MRMRIHPLLMAAVLFTIATLCAVGIVQAQELQTPDYGIPLVAVYPNGNTEDDPANFWAIKLTVTLDAESYELMPDGRFALTGTVAELPGSTVTFVSNGRDQHGSEAWVVLP